MGWISFGGTAGHIAIMHDFLVDKKKWISNDKFLHALSLCMMLPGPEAQQLAIYIGSQLHGKKGGLAAGILFVLPSMFILLGLSMIYVLFGHLPWIAALFNGLKPAVIALIIVALLKVGQKSLKTGLHIAVAVIAFAGMFFFNTSLLSIMGGAIALAFILRYLSPSLFPAKESEISTETAPHKGRFGQLISITFILWLIPISLLYFFSNDFPFWSTLTLFFTKTAFVTIGGSYTVIPYVAQFGVGKFHWLTQTQMTDGFALAETTPGPLIIVLAYIGFMAGYNHFGGSLWMGTIGLLTTTFYTFLPCFLFVFAGAPLVEKSQGNPLIGAILGMVTAVVVGAILNLTLFLGKTVLFPSGTVGVKNIDLFSLAWIALSLLLLKAFKINVIYLILLSIIMGAGHYFLG